MNARVSFYLSGFCGLLLASCVDQKLTLSRNNTGTSPLRLDGFYYSQYLGDSTSYNIIFLYQDGILFQCGWPSEAEFANLEEYFASEIPFRKKEKTSWGLYEIQGNSIVLEGWNTSVGGGLPRFRMEGYIPNDTTIILTRYTSYENRKPKSRAIESGRLQFHAYSPKPDSANNFIPN
ncbi:MAG: hypothetical protein WCY86_05395 [Spirosomataceae bacterium]